MRANFDIDDFRARSAYAHSVDQDPDELDFRDEGTVEAFENFISGYADELVSTAAAEIECNIEVSQDGIRIWRSIMVEDDWLQNGIRSRGLGVCWSFERDAAECHYGDFSEGMREVRLEALVDPGDVDWHATIRLNSTLEEERELRLRDDAFVHVVSAVWIGEGDAIDIDERDVAAGEGAFASRLQCRAA